MMLTCWVVTANLCPCCCHTWLRNHGYEASSAGKQRQEDVRDGYVAMLLQVAACLDCMGYAANTYSTLA